MKLIIDGDIVCYKAGFAAEANDNSVVTAVTCAKEYIHWIINTLIDEYSLDVQEVIIVLSGKGNYRYDLAKTQPYKGNRVASRKPDRFDDIRRYLDVYWNAQIAEGMEADDLMGIMSDTDTIIASQDKDLRMIPGLHFELNDRGVFCAFDPGFLELDRSKKEAKLFGVGFAWFCAQMLMGDRVDNIPGVPGLGPVKVYNLLKDCCTVEEYLNKIIDIYYDHGIIERMDEIAGLLWILRSHDDLKVIKGG